MTIPPNGSPPTAASSRCISAAGGSIQSACRRHRPAPGVRVYAEAGMEPTPRRRVRDLGWEPYAWLIYSLPYLFASFDRRLSGLETNAMLAGYAAFLTLYVIGHLVHGWRVVLIVAAFDLLAIGFSSRNPAAA